MRKTWPIECDAKMLEMLAFCMQTMSGMIQEDIDNGGGCGCGAKQLTVRQLREDLKTANALVAAIAKAELNLAVKTHVDKTKRR
jgi:hypothetical protein